VGLYGPTAAPAPAVGVPEGRQGVSRLALIGLRPPFGSFKTPAHWVE
jgi:hypothetical protein